MSFDENQALAPLTAAWISKIDLAIQAKKPFQEVADECMNFYSGAAGWMWGKKYKDKIISTEHGDVSPRFKFTVAKAFELVALFGPVLYYDNPIRQVNPRPKLQLTPEALQGIGDPNLMMAVQQALMEQQQQYATDSIRAELLSKYLNYTPNELPYGGLYRHAQRAMTESLIKGRGVMLTDLYRREGSDKQLVGSFYIPTDNVVGDPDGESVDDWKWCAVRCTHPHWQLEDEYGFKRDELKKYATLESADTQGELKGNLYGGAERSFGQTNDLVTYWKIWSRNGIGVRMTGVSTPLKDALEQVCGNNCYLVVVKGCPHPLNVRADDLMRPDADQFVRQAVQWPIPFWTDDRWPVSFLDFYEKPGSAWPIAPLQPGLGELQFINIMLSHLCNRIWTSSRDFIAILKAAGEDIKNKIQHGHDQTFIEIESSMGKSINEIVQFLQQPQTNLDVWKILEAVAISFDKRVGLTELVYGMSARQFRSAKEAAVKNDQISIRPDYMSKQVEAWSTEFARKEALAARWGITGETVSPIMGPAAAVLWDALVVSADVDRIVQEMEYRIEAGSTRKPNHDRDVGNAEQAMQILAPIFQQHAVTTGNTQALDALIAFWARAAEFDPGPMTLGSWMDPMKQMQMDQMAMQMQQQQMAAQQAAMGQPPMQQGAPPPQMGVAA